MGISRADRGPGVQEDLSARQRPAADLEVRPRARGGDRRGRLDPAAAARRRAGRAADRRLGVHDPGPGSGGHTTMFRMVSALEQAGHRCILYLREEDGWDIAQHAAIIRSWWPSVKAEIRSVADGIEDAHAIFATAWETAYPVLVSPARGKRFYLVQDFEPSFYPAGSASLLADATYRFGFHHVTAGRWLAEMLRRDYDARADHFDFGRDLTYDLDASVGPQQRTGVTFYSRPTRRAGPTSSASWRLELFAAAPSGGGHPPVRVRGEGPAVPRRPTTAPARPRSSTPCTTARSRGSCCRRPTSRWSRTRCSRRAASRSSTTPSTTGWCSTTRTSRTRRRRRSSSPRRCASSSSGLRPSAGRPPRRPRPACRARSWDDAGAAVVRIVEQAVAGDRVAA